MMYHCRFINYNKCTTLVKSVDNMRSCVCLCLDGWVLVGGCGVEGWMGGCMGACLCTETGDKICKISVLPTLCWQPKTTPQNEAFLIQFQNTRASNQTSRIRSFREGRRRINRPRMRNTVSQDANDIMMNLKKVKKEKGKRKLRCL